MNENEILKLSKDKIKQDIHMIRTLPKWSIEDLRNYYRSESEKEPVINEKNINWVKSDVLYLLKSDLMDNYYFLKQYRICKKVYGQDININSKDDIVCYEKWGYYYLLVPSKSISILLDRNYNVVKTNFEGHEYVLNGFLINKPISFYELAEDTIYFYESAESEPINLGACHIDNNYHIKFLKGLTAIPFEGGLYKLYNQSINQITVEDYDRYQFNIETFLGEEGITEIQRYQDSLALLHKKLKYNDQEAHLIYTINRKGFINSNVIDVITRKIYPVDKKQQSKEEIKRIYNLVLEELKVKKNKQKKLSMS